MVSRLIHEVPELYMVPELNLSGLFLGRDLHISYCLWLYNPNSLRWFKDTAAKNMIRYGCIYLISFHWKIYPGLDFLVLENYLENIH